MLIYGTVFSQPHTSRFSMQRRASSPTSISSDGTDDDGVEAPLLAVDVSGVPPFPCLALVLRRRG
jgi:hypothetical protein